MGAKDERKEKRSAKSSVVKIGEDLLTKTSRRSSSRRSESTAKESGSPKDNKNRRSLSKSRNTSMELLKSSSSKSLSTPTKRPKKLLLKSDSSDSSPSKGSSRSSRSSSSRSLSISPTKSPKTLLPKSDGSESSPSRGSSRSSRRSLSKSGSSTSLLGDSASPRRLSKSGSSKSPLGDGASSSSRLSKRDNSNSLSKYGNQWSDIDGLPLSESKRNNKTKSEKIQCSLCKRAEAAMRGMCEHKFCARCFMNVVYKPLECSIVNSGHLEAPTIGRCPKCRLEVWKDQVRFCKNRKLTPRLPLPDPEQKIKYSSIAGKVFVPKEKDPKFCFDEDQPYIDLKEAVAADKANWILNDGSPVPDKVVFEDGCFFDEESQTFHGKIKWPVTIRGAYQWDVLLAFKEGCSVMHMGVIHERKERVLDDAYFKDASEEEIVRLQYPFDGTWKITWKNADNEEKVYKFTVRDNGFQQGRYLFNLNMSDPTKVFFRWPGDTVTADVVSGINLMRYPMGPEIGEVVFWKTGHPSFPKGFTWERLTFGEMPRQGTLHFGGGNDGYVGRKGKELDSKADIGFSGFDDPSETDSDEFFLYDDDLGGLDMHQAISSWQRYSQVLDMNALSQVGNELLV